MTLFAWNGYKKYAWGKNELRSVSKRGYSPGIFGSAHTLGATIVDSLDTLYLMGLDEEFIEGAEWIRKYFNIKIVGVFRKSF
jgi:mannosyl-oligosaccharide alpha-1,2-mannosidase